MLKQNRRRSRRARNLVVVCGLTAVVLSVSTYAWFVGMKTVNVSSFDVQIATTESLSLSLDGSKWGSTISISQDTFNTASYAGNTNTWGGAGLIPVSSIGDMDTASSRMKIFEKASLTTTAGGYRLLASRVNNMGANEQDGYVAFDLFVRNYSGTQYITALNPLDEEAIYLTTDSAVTVAADGVANTGIENSVRVAFAEIGRVIGTSTDASTIDGITCTSAGDVTGICRTAQIWEPNDKLHTANAISWYNTSCKARTGEDVTAADSYSGTCGTVANNTAYPTYAVSAPIASSDNVDIYDGAAYNSYTNSALLVPYAYFTDTMKNLTSTSRPTFITLAPNSITKIRIYIYIEGQDVDNYDFASIGKKISVKFGLTKERLTTDDISYTGPTIHVPVISLIGDSTVTITKGSTYTDAGATATDNVDGNLTSSIVTTGTVDTEVPGTYVITYNVSDNSQNSATPVTRTVIVTD